MARAFGAGFAAAALAFVPAFALVLALAAGAGFARDFAAALATGLAETVFLAFVGLADGFLAGIDGLQGLCEGRGIIQTAGLWSSGQAARGICGPRRLSGAVGRVTFFYTSFPFKSLADGTP